MLILMAESRGAVRRDRLERSAKVLSKDEPFASLGAEKRTALIREQTIVVEFAPERAIADAAGPADRVRGPPAGDRRRRIIAGSREEMDPADHQDAGENARDARPAGAGRLRPRRRPARRHRPGSSCRRAARKPTPPTPDPLRRHQRIAEARRTPGFGRLTARCGAAMPRLRRGATAKPRDKPPPFGLCRNGKRAGVYQSERLRNPWRRRRPRSIPGTRRAKIGAPAAQAGRARRRPGAGAGRGPISGLWAAISKAPTTPIPTAAR